MSKVLTKIRAYRYLKHIIFQLRANFIILVKEIKDSHMVPYQVDRLDTIQYFYPGYHVGLFIGCIGTHVA